VWRAAQRLLQSPGDGDAGADENAPSEPAVVEVNDQRTPSSSRVEDLGV
jgi:hypothetical protein